MTAKAAVAPAAPLPMCNDLALAVAKYAVPVPITTREHFRNRLIQTCLSLADPPRPALHLRFLKSLRNEPLAERARILTAQASIRRQARFW